MTADRVTDEIADLRDKHQPKHTQLVKVQGEVTDTVAGKANAVISAEEERDGGNPIVEGPAIQGRAPMFRGHAPAFSWTTSAACSTRASHEPSSRRTTRGSRRR